LNEAWAGSSTLTVGSFQKGKNMKTQLLIGLLALGAVPAFANDVLSCPTGTRQVGGAKSFMEATGCQGPEGFNGPYITYWQNGSKSSVGQYDRGNRTGKWTYFDQQGIKTGETEFKGGDYHGTRVEFWANGQKKLVETYVMGSREGTQLTFDAAGRQLSATTFNKDRAVSAK
jgi:hypothetical protein